MNNNHKNFRNSLDKIVLSDETKNKLLENILTEGREGKKLSAASPRNRFYKVGIAAAVVLLIASVVVSVCWRFVVPVADAPESSTAMGEIAELPYVEITVYFPSEDGKSLSTKVLERKRTDADTLIDVLITEGIIPSGTKVNQFYVEDHSTTTVSGGVATHTIGKRPGHLDLSGAFLEGLSEEEKSIVVAAVVNTFIQNCYLDTLEITVDGEYITVNGTAYDYPMNFWSEG